MARPIPMTPAERARRYQHKKRGLAGIPKGLSMRAPGPEIKVAMVDGRKVTTSIEPTREERLAWHRAWIAILETQA